MNVTDEDGDTPLFTVENIETARFLIDNEADPVWRNHDGLTVCQTFTMNTPTEVVLASSLPRRRFPTSSGLSEFHHFYPSRQFSIWATGESRFRPAPFAALTRSGF